MAFLRDLCERSGSAPRGSAGVLLIVACMPEYFLRDHGTAQRFEEVASNVTIHLVLIVGLFASSVCMLPPCGRPVASL